MQPSDLRGHNPGPGHGLGASQSGALTLQQWARACKPLPLNSAALPPKGANHPKEGSRRMQASTPTRGTTRVTTLPEAGREDMCKEWGLSASAHWPETDRRPPRLDDVAGGDSRDDPESAEQELEELGFIMDGGWHLAQAGKGHDRHVGGGGMTSHRGILHPDEYVDTPALRGAVERELGFTYEQVRSVYRQGPLSAEQRELRASVDARLLALSCAGGQMLELAKAFGWAIRPSGTDGGNRSDTMERAIERARGAQVAA